jgi:chromosome segregation ATPase
MLVTEGLQAEAADIDLVVTELTNLQKSIEEKETELTNLQKSIEEKENSVAELQKTLEEKEKEFFDKEIELEVNAVLANKKFVSNKAKAIVAEELANKVKAAKEKELDFDASDFIRELEESEDLAPFFAKIVDEGNGGAQNDKELFGKMTEADPFQSFGDDAVMSLLK